MNDSDILNEEDDEDDKDEEALLWRESTEFTELREL